ncbi:MAG: hypothetical protein ACO1PI_16305 [Bacteroidota bacterium]
MKRIFTLLIFTFSFLLGNSQLKFAARSLLYNDNVYKTKDTLILERVYDHKKGVALKDKRIYRLIVSPLPFVKYNILENGDNAYIYILPNYNFKYDTGGRDSIVDIVFTDGAKSDTVYNYYFRVKSANTPNTKYLSSQSIVGMPVTLPLKIRKLDTELQFESNLSLSYAFGYRIKVGNNPYRKKYINVIPVAFAINSDKYFTAKEDSKIDALSFTYYSFGLTYEVNGFNIGLFGGWDKMFGTRKDWIYQDRFWGSLGIGYKFGE